MKFIPGLEKKLQICTDESHSDNGNHYGNIKHDTLGQTNYIAVELKNFNNPKLDGKFLTMIAKINDESGTLTWICPGDDISGKGLGPAEFKYLPASCRMLGS